MFSVLNTPRARKGRKHPINGKFVFTVGSDAVVAAPRGLSLPQVLVLQSFTARQHAQSGGQIAMWTRRTDIRSFVSANEPKRDERLCQRDSEELIRRGEFAPA
jgi:hypothetical protein